jgi:multimeric flavodoxin WrbA
LQNPDQTYYLVQKRKDIVQSTVQRQKQEKGEIGIAKKIVFIQGASQKNGNIRAMVALVMNAAQEVEAEAIVKLLGCDVIVLATPLYWWSYTAQLKIMIDRMY